MVLLRAAVIQRLGERVSGSAEARSIAFGRYTEHATPTTPRSASHSDGHNGSPQVKKDVKYKDYLELPSSGWRQFHGWRH